MASSHRTTVMGLVVATAVLMVSTACSSLAQQQSALALTAVESEACSVLKTTSQEVLPGITLTYDSAIWCQGVSDEGSYRITATIGNSATSVEGVVIDALALRLTTPRPRGQTPSVELEADAGLPLRVEPGMVSNLTLAGTYALVATGDGKKANVHIHARGYGENSGVRFNLGINIHLRGEGTAERDTVEAGRPVVPPGPPFEVPPPWTGPRGR